MKRTRINPVNRARCRKMFERNYGPNGARGAAVRDMGCEVARVRQGTSASDAELLDQGWQGCGGDIVAAHVVPRGKGACNSNDREIVGLCVTHDTEAGEGKRDRTRPTKRAAFESTYGIDLYARADTIAAELTERGIP